MDKDQLTEVLALHSHWLRTSGREGRRASLNGADLRLLDLAGADLTSALLAGANLERADLRGARLANANLQGAKLSYANLDKASLKGANLCRAEGRGMSCHETDFSRASLREASLDHSTFYSSDFSAADARGAIIRGGEFFATNLSGSNFAGALMAHTNLSNCATKNTDFAAVDWRGGDSKPDGTAESLLLNFQRIMDLLRFAERAFFAVAGAGFLLLLAAGLWSVWCAATGQGPAPLSRPGYAVALGVTASGVFFGAAASLARILVTHKAYHFRKSERMERGT